MHFHIIWYCVGWIKTEFITLEPVLNRWNCIDLDKTLDQRKLMVKFHDNSVNPESKCLTLYFSTPFEFVMHLHTNKTLK